MKSRLPKSAHFSQAKLTRSIISFLLRPNRPTYWKNMFHPHFSRHTIQPESPWQVSSYHFTTLSLERTFFLTFFHSNPPSSILLKYLFFTTSARIVSVLISIFLKSVVDTPVQKFSLIQYINNANDSINYEKGLTKSRGIGENSWVISLWKRKVITPGLVCRFFAVPSSDGCDRSRDRSEGTWADTYSNPNLQGRCTRHLHLPQSISCCDIAISTTGEGGSVSLSKQAAKTNGSRPY